MGLPSVFISYNPNSDIEQTLAVRLHTIGAVHGFNMLLPDRRGFGSVVSSETRSRILEADFFILFSTSSLSSTVLNEIQIASSKLHEKSKILVIYDITVGKNLAGADNFTEVYINRSSSIEEILNTILTKVKGIQSNGNDQGGFFSVLGPILLTGLGLFALASVLDEPRRPKRRLPKKKNAPAKKAKKAVKKVKANATNSRYR
jgi:hypothetical protein